MVINLPRRHIASIWKKLSMPFVCFTGKNDAINDSTVSLFFTILINKGEKYSDWTKNKQTNKRNPNDDHS